MILDDSYSIYVVTGPESTGKSALVKSISEKYNIPQVDEFARLYLERNGPKYEWKDLVKIAKCQCIQEKYAHNLYPMIVCDTDIVTVDIWSMEKFQKPIGIANPDSKEKHYILCKPNIPWVDDPLRENPNDRDRLFEVYKKYMENMDYKYSIWEDDRIF